MKKYQSHVVKWKWKSHKHYDEQKKPGTKEQMPYDSIYMTSKIDQLTYGDSSGNSGRY